MTLTRFTDYSLRVLMYLSTRPQDEKVSLEFLSTHFNMNHHHLNKVSQRLVALSWVKSSRGKQGGLTIVPETMEMNLSDIVTALEPEMKPIDCEGVECPIAGACKLERILLDASSAFLQVLAQYQLKDVARGRGRFDFVKTLFPSDASLPG